MTDNQALLARLDKDKLDYLFSSVLALVGEKTEVLIFEPETQHDEKWVIVARGHALRVAAEMMGQFASYCETQQMSLQWLDMVASIVKNPNDQSLRLTPYVPMGEDVQAYPMDEEETSTMTGEDYNNIDQKFIVIYASLKAYYENIYEICQQASQFHTTMSHNLSQDVSLHFCAGDGLDIAIACYDGLTGQVAKTLSWQNNKGDFVSFFAADASGGKTKALPFGQKIGRCLDGMNNLLTDFVNGYHDDIHKQNYASLIASDFAVTLIRVGGAIPFYQCGNGIDNIEDHPEIMGTLDTLTSLILHHMANIPASAMGEELSGRVNHYAFDYENFLIYARDKNYRVIGELTDPQYAITRLINAVSEGTYSLLTTRLAELRNKHVFKKIGKLVMDENPNVLH